MKFYFKVHDFFCGFNVKGFFEYKIIERKMFDVMSTKIFSKFSDMIDNSTILMIFNASRNLVQKMN